jgi:hypothetical protein
MDHARPRSTVDRPWTAAPGSPALRPPAAPVSTGAGQGAREEEWNVGSSVGGSVAARRRGGAMVVVGGSMGRRSGVVEEKRGAR